MRYIYIYIYMYISICVYPDIYNVFTRHNSHMYTYIPMHTYVLKVHMYKHIYFCAVFHCIYV